MAAFSRRQGAAPSWRLAGSLALTFLLGASCGRQAADELADGLNLLAREPDTIQGQAGVLLPDPELQWGERGAIGWATRTETDPKAHVWTVQKEAYLELDAGSPADRTISLEAWRTQPQEEQSVGEVRLLLNDVALGTLDVQPEPQSFELHAPSAAWRRGRNILAITVEHLTLDPTGHKTGIAVSSVRYAAPREVDVRAGEGVLLPPDTSVCWNVSPLVPSILVVSGEAQGSGSLELELVTLDVEKGGELDVVNQVTVPLDGGELERPLPLPGSTGAVYQVRIGWTGEDDSDFEISGLHLVESEPASRPPIFLIAVDTLAAQNMSLYGYERETTPALDAFAGDCVVFDNCRTNAPWTLPSFMATMTGLYAGSHRLQLPWSPNPRPLWEKWYLSENRWTLAEALSAFGYRTGGFVDNLWLTDRFGFPQGFEHYDSSAGEISQEDVEGGIRRTSRLADEWIDSLPEDAPFFAFIHCFDVHGPYHADEAYHGRFRGDDLGREGRVAPGNGMANVYGIVPEYVTTVEYAGEPSDRVDTSRLRSAYDEGVGFTDHELGRFFDRLKAEGLYERSIIVVFADHGETQDADPLLFGHGVVSDSVVHVPLLMKLPGGRASGTRVSDAVQLVDLYPTLLDLIQPGYSRGDLHGRSLVPLLDDETLSPHATLTESGIMEQYSVDYGSWRAIVRRPPSRSPAEFILGHPELLKTVRSRSSDRATSAEYDELERFLAPVYEHGLTQEAFDQLRASPRFRANLALCRQLVPQHELEVYDLEQDPDLSDNLATKARGQTRALLRALEEEKARRDRAQALALPPNRPAKLSAEDVAELGRLGYAEMPSDEEE